MDNLDRSEHKEELQAEEAEVVGGEPLWEEAALSDEQGSRIIEEVQAAAAANEEEPWDEGGYEEEELEYAPEGRGAKWLAGLALLLSAAAFAGSALGYLPLGGVKGEQIADGAIGAGKLAPGAVGLDSVSLELREQLQGPPGPRGPRGPKGEPGTGLSGIALADREVKASEDGTASGRVRCPRGKAISGGATVQGAGEGQVVAITESAVLDGRAGWRATARQIQLPDAAELEGLLREGEEGRRARPETAQHATPSWSLDIHVVCAVAAQGGSGN